MVAGYRLLMQSGHGHWSQPQPVHAWRIMRAILAAAGQGNRGQRIEQRDLG
jgi:hypothetical protein